MIAESSRVSLEVLLLAVITSGVVTTVISWLVSRKKTSAETEGIVADTYSQVLGDMRAELTRYQRLLDAAYARIASLERDVKSNVHRIRDLEQLMMENNLTIPEGPPTPPHGHPSLWGPISGEEDPSDTEGAT